MPKPVSWNFMPALAVNSSKLPGTLLTVASNIDPVPECACAVENAAPLKRVQPPDPGAVCSSKPGSTSRLTLANAGVVCKPTVARIQMAGAPKAWKVFMNESLDGGYGDDLKYVFRPLVKKRFKTV